MFNTRLNASVVAGDVAAHGASRPLHSRMEAAHIALFPGYLHSTFTTKSYNTKEWAFL